MDSLYLPTRHSWFMRVLGRVPDNPASGDRGPVVDAVHEVLDAAGGVEFAVESLKRAEEIAQDEHDRLVPSKDSPNWAGENTPAVYYGFANVAIWTRTVDDRFRGRLRPSIKHDPALLTSVDQIRDATAGPAFDDARTIADTGLHLYTQPYANFSAKVVSGALVYPVVDPINIKKKADFRKNIRFAVGRHAAALAKDYWNGVTLFVHKLLDELYPA